MSKDDAAVPEPAKTKEELQAIQQIPLSRLAMLGVGYDAPRKTYRLNFSWLSSYLQTFPEDHAWRQTLQWDEGEQHAACVRSDEFALHRHNSDGAIRTDTYLNFKVDGAVKMTQQDILGKDPKRGWGLAVKQNKEVWRLAARPEKKAKFVHSLKGVEAANKAAAIKRVEALKARNTPLLAGQAALSATSGEFDTKDSSSIRRITEETTIERVRAGIKSGQIPGTDDEKAMRVFTNMLGVLLHNMTVKYNLSKSSNDGYYLALDMRSLLKALFNIDAEVKAAVRQLSGQSSKFHMHDLLRALACTILPQQLSKVRVGQFPEWNTLFAASRDQYETIAFAVCETLVEHSGPGSSALTKAVNLLSCIVRVSAMNTKPHVKVYDDDGTGDPGGQGAHFDKPGKDGALQALRCSVLLCSTEVEEGPPFFSGSVSSIKHLEDPAKLAKDFQLYQIFRRVHATLTIMDANGAGRWPLARDVQNAGQRVAVHGSRLPKMSPVSKQMRVKKSGVSASMIFDIPHGDIEQRTGELTGELGAVLRS